MYEYAWCALYISAQVDKYEHSLAMRFLNELVSRFDEKTSNNYEVFHDWRNCLGGNAMDKRWEIISQSTVVIAIYTRSFKDDDLATLFLQVAQRRMHSTDRFIPISLDGEDYYMPEYVRSILIPALFRPDFLKDEANWKRLLLALTDKKKLSVVIPKGAFVENHNVGESAVRTCQGLKTTLKMDKFLSRFSHLIGSEWRSLALELGLNGADLDRLRNDFHNSQDVNYEMLRLWNNRSQLYESQRIEQLLNILLERNYHELHRQAGTILCELGLHSSPTAQQPLDRRMDDTSGYRGTTTRRDTANGGEGAVGGRGDSVETNAQCAQSNRPSTSTEPTHDTRFLQAQDERTGSEASSQTKEKSLDWMNTRGPVTTPQQSDQHQAAGSGIFTDDSDMPDNLGLLPESNAREKAGHQTRPHDVTQDVAHDTPRLSRKSNEELLPTGGEMQSTQRGDHLVSQRVRQEHSSLPEVDQNPNNPEPFYYQEQHIEEGSEPNQKVNESRDKNDKKGFDAASLGSMDSGLPESLASHDTTTCKKRIDSTNTHADGFNQRPLPQNRTKSANITRAPYTRGGSDIQNRSSSNTTSHADETLAADIGQINPSMSAGVNNFEVPTTGDVGQEDATQDVEMDATDPGYVQDLTGGNEVSASAVSSGNGISSNQRSSPQNRTESAPIPDSQNSCAGNTTADETSAIGVAEINPAMGGGVNNSDVPPTGVAGQEDATQGVETEATVPGNIQDLTSQERGASTSAVSSGNRIVSCLRDWWDFLTLND